MARVHACSVRADVLDGLGGLEELLVFGVPRLPRACHRRAMTLSLTDWGADAPSMAASSWVRPQSGSAKRMLCPRDGIPQRYGAPRPVAMTSEKLYRSAPNATLSSAPHELPPPDELRAPHRRRADDRIQAKDGLLFCLGSSVTSDAEEMVPTGGELTLIEAVGRLGPDFLLFCRSSPVGDVLA
jgi:hypothetical protein